MKIETAINMAVTAVMCDMRLPQEIKEEIIDGLRNAERLTEIGMATERLLDDEIEGYMVSGRIVDGKLVDTKAIDSVDELLEWYGAI